MAAAFDGHPHSDGSEVALLHALARDGDLARALVAVDDGVVVGQVALSPVAIEHGPPGWYGLGPLAVRPDRQRQGVGTALVQAALAWLAAQGAGGCVVVGDPAYYGRFGFAATPGLVLPGFPPAFFQALRLSGQMPQGTVRYARAFGLG